MFREGTKEFEELMSKYGQQRAEKDAEKLRNDPYEIARYSNDCGASVMDTSTEGEWVKWSDYVDKIERLKKTHEQELRKARERGYSDGQDSNYSWRL